MKQWGIKMEKKFDIEICVEADPLSEETRLETIARLIVLAERNAERLAKGEEIEDPENLIDLSELTGYSRP